MSGDYDFYGSSFFFFHVYIVCLASIPISQRNNKNNFVFNICINKYNHVPLHN